MRIKIYYLLVIILIFNIIGCSRQYSTPVKLKQEYVNNISPTLVTDIENTINLSIDLYNQVKNNSIPDTNNFEYKYTAFKTANTKAENANSKDIIDHINTFGDDLSKLSMDDLNIKLSQKQRDEGKLSKDFYDKDIKESNQQKILDIKKIQSDFDSLMKYFQ